MRHRLLAFSTCAVLAAAGCAPSSGAPAADGGPAARASWSPSTPPAEIAAGVLATCQNAAERGACLEQELVAVIEPAGVDRAMGALMAIAARDAAVRNDGHVYAHGIGIAAYRGPETVSETFGRCTTDFQSGCYHGVIQAYFSDDRTGGGVTAEKLNALCADYRGPDKRWLEFQCAHGMGHGLMAVNEHHLLRALDGCDLLSETFEKQACWGGAFMENVVNETHPHHTATTQGAADEHAGHGAQPAEAAQDDGHDHDHGELAEGAESGAEEEKFRALDREEPLYPCTVVKEHHRRQCYLMQTSAILFYNGGDFAAASEQCLRAPAELQQTCFQSLGRDANSWSDGNPQRGIRYCGQAPAEWAPYCIVGLVKNIVDVTARPSDGLRFCRSVPEASKSACYRAVGQQIWVLHGAVANRERECRSAEAGFITECRFGAGLPLVRSETS